MRLKSGSPSTWEAVFLHSPHRKAADHILIKPHLYYHVIIMDHENCPASLNLQTKGVVM